MRQASTNPAAYGGGAVEVVSVVVGDDVSVLVVLVSVCSGGGVECSCFGLGGVVVPAVSMTTGVSALDVRGCIGRIEMAGYVVVAGSESAVSLLGRLVGIVRFVVVPAFVAVAVRVVSPGPLIVDVTPAADPSCTTLYCC